MLVIGVDEAGYGPLLGPLVVAGTAFRMTGEPDLETAASRLEAALSGSGVAVGDSKRIFGGTRDLAALELPVLAFLAAGGGRADRLDDLLAAIGADPGVRAAPWYAAEPGRFPVATDAEAVADSASRLRSALGAGGIEFLTFAADVVPESRLNAAFETGNKADALFAAAAGVFDRLRARRAEGEPVVAVFDRQGGRHHYGALLQRRWPEALAWTLAESATRSDYRLHFAESSTVLRFEVEADGGFPQVGLASMLAKYTREVFMGLFNHHFAGICPGVEPTAGYVEDGRRWLAATRASRTAAGVPDSDLVRLR